MTKPTQAYYFSNKIARSLPFFFTAATCLDYLLTPTSLEFFEWIKFESIYNTLFENIYKMKDREGRIPGLRMPNSQKLPYGIGGTFV
jgi:Piezo non-specific cation channel, R-Ras-binding domain